MKKLGIVAMIMALLLLLVTSVSATVSNIDLTPLTADEDTAYTGTVTADTDDAITGYALADGHPAWLSIDPDTGELTGTPAAADIGDNEVTIEVTDGDGMVDEDFTIVVSEVNDAPVITSTAGTSAVEDHTYTYDVEATDEEDDTLTYALTTAPDGMTIDSSTGVITWIPDEEQIGSNSVTVQVTDDGTPAKSTTQSFSVFVRPEEVCEEYTGGSDVRIVEWEITDDDEDFYPGDIIEIEVEVENDGDDDLEDIVVEVMLYDVTDGEKLDVVKTDEFDLDEDEDEVVELILKIPKDIDPDNEIIVFVSAYEDGNDDDNCNWGYDNDLDFKRRKHDVSIEDVTIYPEIVKAGKTVEVTVDVENVGDRDEEDVYVKVKNGELGIDKKSELFDVDKYEKGDDDEYTVTVTFTVPADAEDGDYDLEINVYDEDGEIYESGTKFVTLEVEGTSPSTPSTPTTPTGSVTVSTEGTPETVEKGKAFTIPVLVTNTASESKEYKITVANIGDWAESTSEFDVFLTEGQSSTYYITMTPYEDATEGMHSATINVKEGTSVITTKTLSFTIPETETSGITGGAVVDVADEEGGFFQNVFSGTTLWIIADIILIVVAIFFVKMLFSKKS